MEKFVLLTLNENESKRVCLILEELTKSLMKEKADLSEHRVEIFKARQKAVECLESGKDISFMERMMLEAAIKLATMQMQKIPERMREIENELEVYTSLKEKLKAEVLQTFPE